MAKINRRGYEGLLSLPDATQVLNNESWSLVSADAPTELHVALHINRKWKGLENVLTKLEGMLTPTEGRYLCQLARSKPGKGVILIPRTWLHGDQRGTSLCSGSAQRFG